MGDDQMSVLLESRKKQLDEEGYVLIENVIPEAERQQLVERLNRLYSSLESAGANTYPGDVGKTERLILNLHNKDERFVELLDHPAVFPLVQHMMQDGSYQNKEPFIVTQFSARDPHVGIPAQQLHIDSRFPGPPFALMTIVLWMLNDFTLESGATRLVPKSHLRPSYPENGVEYPDEIRAVAPAGSVLIYNGSAWHGGGAKLLDLERWSVIVSYSRWFVKPAFDMTQNTPPELYAKLTPDRRELFGFTSIPPSDEQLRSRARISPSELPDAI
jgi:ectoine hydroxylase-related dioxygenase (phytanoyl-CoA dioxygenase family)